MNPNPKALMSVEAALDHLLSAVRPLAAPETVPTGAAYRRVLAEGLVSPMNVPPADNTQMDGFAVASAECAQAGARLMVSQRIAAGHVGGALKPHTAARIFTGGLIPEGADAVVMQEQADLEETPEGPMVTIRHVPQAGEWIRRAGEDIRAGASILEAGTVLRAQELGLAASVGVATLAVARRPRVAIFFTGDELAMPGDVLRPGAIYNSSRFTLNGLLEGMGCVVTDLGIIPDTLEATRAALRTAAAGHDCIITSGGVSVGEEDHVKPAVEAEGELDLWQIAIKPGKPLAFGRVGEAVFLGLPGNPVSSFVAFLIFVRPVLLRLQGARQLAVRRYALRADFAWPRPDRRQEYLRVRVNEQGGLELFANQGSAVLTSTVWGDGLVENPPGRAIAPGDTVQFIPFAELGS